MPRRKRSDKISGYYLGIIERQAELLQLRMREASTSLTPFKLHYDTLHEISQALTRGINVLNDRPEDYEKPHRGPMQG